MEKSLSILFSIAAISTTLFAPLLQKKSAVKATEPSQTSFEVMVQSAQTSVVRIDLQILTPLYEIKDPELRKAFESNSRITIGTGFIVNDKGDIVTADHVLADLHRDEEKLSLEKITSVAGVGIVQGSQEVHSPVTVISAGNSNFFEFSVKDEDVVHDLAVVHPVGNIFEPPEFLRKFGVATLTRPTVALIDEQRPLDGSDTFLLGFPLGSDVIVTVSGRVASAWATENLLYAARNGFTEMADVYKLDSRIDRGDSGGPLFSSRNQSVIGMVVETKGNLGVAVPSKYIVAMLHRDKIPWTSTTTANK